MASITPRASGFWTDSRMSYFPDDELEGDVEEQQNLVPGDDPDDGRTPLDKTIDQIGMGSYQWTLLLLCGFGWMADNMWIQAVAIILPRVQQQYSVPDSYIGSVSSSMFAGMMFGAVGWGTCSDLMGRSAAFNATLFFTSLFGLLTSIANSFPTLCVLLFFLGSAVGGSMPTDGTLLLEHMPQGRKHLVTALSVFFSFGAVLAAVVGLQVIPQHSCQPSMLVCDVESQNKGWKYLLITLGLITLSMFLARIVFFRLHESPRYLVHAGRPREAIESLQMISRFNGSDLSLELEDVEDHRRPLVTSPTAEVDESNIPFLHSNTQKLDTPEGLAPTTIFDGGAVLDGNQRPSPPTQSSAEFLRTGQPAVVVDYNSTGESPTPLESHSYATPADENPPTILSAEEPAPTKEASSAANPVRSYSPSPAVPRPRRPRPSLNIRQSHISISSARRTSSAYEKRVCNALPRWMRKPLWAWWGRVCMMLTPEWQRTTILVWTVWCAMSLAYTMFNVFLPKLLELGRKRVLAEKTLEDSLWDVVIFTIGGCPGAILGAYMIESPLGRRWSLAGSTFITAFLCMVFVWVDSLWAVRASTVGISLSSTAMWAVLYGWTPEIFGTKVRGTAGGIASALSRIGGMIAPMLGGVLLMIDRSVPVYTSVVIFAIAGICVLLLKEDEGDGGKTTGERVIAH